MSYYTGTIAAVPTAGKREFVDHASAAWLLFNKHGATRMIETWGADVPRGKVNDFFGAVNAEDGETVIFSWIEWPDKTTADAAWQAMEQDPAMQQMPPMPFDGSRMIFGGFAPIFERGNPNSGRYYQGFTLAVPEKNKAAYIAMAMQGWAMLENGGALGLVECWGEDVPRGKKTDFYRATKAEHDEIPVFAWIAWPDRATCDVAAKAMQEGDHSEMPEMPFDGMRMMWGGVEPIFDSGAAQ